jgi:hypothetical protein
MNIVAFALTEPNPPVAEILNVFKDVDDIHVVMRSTTIEQDVDANGTPKFQENGIDPIMKSLDDQLVHLDTIDPNDERLFHTYTNTRELNGETITEVFSDALNAINQVVNPYMTTLSHNQHLDDQNTLHEKHGRLEEIKPLDILNPIRLFLFVNTLPQQLSEFQRSNTRLADMLTKKTISKPTDIRVCIFLVNDQSNAIQYYNELKEEDGVIVYVGNYTDPATLEAELKTLV